MRDAYSLITNKNYRHIPNLFIDDRGWRGSGGIVVHESRTMEQVEEALRINQGEVQAIKDAKAKKVKWKKLETWQKDYLFRYAEAKKEVQRKKQELEEKNLRAEKEKQQRRDRLNKEYNKRRGKILYVEPDPDVMGRIFARKAAVLEDLFQPQIIAYLPEIEPLGKGWKRHQKRTGEEYFTFGGDDA